MCGGAVAWLNLQNGLTSIPVENGIIKAKRKALPCLTCGFQMGPGKTDKCLSTGERIK